MFGESVTTRQGVDAITLMQQTLTYDLAQGFPVITERDLTKFWRKPIGELCAFINGATSDDELRNFGCDWWTPWTVKEKTVKRGLQEGHLGPGSYGGAFKHFPDGTDDGFDQFGSLVEEIIKYPTLRTHFITPWIPQYQIRDTAKTTISPCHGWVHVRIINNRIHLHMFQRSGDVPVGVPSNMIQYAALMLMLEQLTGYKAGIYYHTISDAHIYNNQIEAVNQMLNRKPYPLPLVVINQAGRKITDIHDFRAEHFDLSGYKAHPGLRIPVSV